MYLPHRNPSVGLAVAVVATATATLLRLALVPVLGPNAPYTIYLLAVVATAWLGGFWPGLTATALGYVAAEALFVQPYGATTGPFSIVGPAEAVRFTSYALVGLAISFVSEQWHRARLRYLERARRLEEEVSERLRSAEELRQSTRALASLVSAAPIPIVVISPDRTVRLWNRAAERVFGWSAGEVEGKPIPIVPDDKREECAGAREAVARGETLGPIATYRVRKDGTHVDVELSAAPLYNAESLVDSMVLLLNDVSEQRRTERSLLESQAMLREADRRKDAFLATLAHELRNPLAPIRNALQILSLPANDEGATERSRKMMERQIAHMVRLIEDLLDVSRIASGKIELRRARIHLQDAVLSAVETARTEIDTHRHELTVTLPEEPIELDADMTRLSQAFSNLLHNAAKYTDPGGRIAVVARVENKRAVDAQGGDAVDGAARGARGADAVDGAAKGVRAVICVSDTGIGIAPDVLPRIFGLFMQADPAQTSRGGLGVGLSLVKQLIEAHGGTVEASSAGPGLGSEFVVTLPAVDKPGAAVPVQPVATRRAPTQPEEVSFASSSAPYASKPPARRRVLVVDDNEDSVESLAALIRIMGHECETALDGRSAIALAASYRPDTILLDIGMPEMSGNEACRAIRGQSWGREIYLIALTGWGQAEDRQRTHDAGFDLHLVKPVEPSLLQKLLAGAPAATSPAARPGPSRSDAAAQSPR